MNVGDYGNVMRMLHGDNAGATERTAEEARKKEEALKEQFPPYGPKKTALQNAMIDAFRACQMLETLDTHWPGWQSRAKTEQEVAAVRAYREAEHAWRECPVTE